MQAHGAPAPADPGRDRAVLIEQLESTCRFMPAALLLSVVASLVLTLIYAYYNGLLIALFGWIGLLAVTSVGRYAFVRHFHARSGEYPVQAWALGFTILAGLAGFAWSVPASGLLPGIAAASRPALASVTGAIAAIGGYSLFPYFPAYAAFALGTCLPVIIGVIRSDNLILNQIGITLAFFIVMVLGAGRRLSAAHRDLIVTRLDLEQTQRVAQSASNAKNRFLANMSHELRTPLNGVIGMADLLLRTSLDERQHRQASTIARSGRTLLAILTDILDIAKIEAGKLTLVARDFELPAAVDEVDSLFRARATEKGLEFRIVWHPRVPRAVRGDRVRFVQILGNLVANAVKFTERGSVEVRILPAGETDPGLNALRVRCEVVDTGIGLAPEQCTRIFDSFEQADDGVARRFGGTGLGLAIARQLVVAQGGEIGVTSEPAVGTTFWFELPFARSTALGTDAMQARVSTPRKAAPAATPLGRAASVLVVEDNPANREVMRSMLEELGLDSAFATDGVDALNRFGERQFDLVLMDCQMPHMDGFETTQRLRSIETRRGITDHVPVIAVTAHAIEGYRERCLTAGMNDYLTKPVTVERLRETIERHLKRAAADGPAAALTTS